MHTTLPSNTLNKLTPRKAMRAALTGLLVIFACAAAHDVSAQGRTDNRRIFWTGSNGMVWDNNTTSSWMTTGTYLTYVSATYTSPTWAETDALPDTPFISGDTVIFDSTSDLVSFVDPDTGEVSTPSSAITRTINIADAGVTASDLVISGPGSYVFTGGAITTDASSVVAGSPHFTGTGVGPAGDAVLPSGRLVKIGLGELTLSNTVANVFTGGIHLGQGTLTIADPRALGDNDIYVLTVTATTLAAGDIYGQNISNKALLSVPGTVLDASGNILRAGSQSLNSAGSNSAIVSAATVRVPASADGLDITGDVYLASHILTFDIEGDTTISGRLYGTNNNYGANGGTFIKEGTGTLTITGTQNWFYGNYKKYNEINAGRVVITSPHAIGTGATSISSDAVLEFRGVVGTMRQAFVGNGNIEITQGSDVTFNWRNGTLDDFDGMSGNGSWHPAMNEIGRIQISGQSRLSAIASGTYSTVLGGANAYVSVTEGSTLLIGREGLSARGSGATAIPMTYAVLANRIELSEGSTLVLTPNAYLNTGALLVDDSPCNIAFTASGVARLRWKDGVDPDTITTDITVSSTLRYIVPEGMELIINEIPVPIASTESIPADTSAAGWAREYVLVNQGANPLKDVAMTLIAVDAVHDTVNARIADELVDPVTLHVPAKGRKWVNEAWVRYMRSEIEFDNESISSPGMDATITGVVAGLEGLLPGRVLLGVHAGIAENNIETDNNTSLSSKQKFLGIHAAQRFGKFYLSFAAATGKVSTDSFRYETGSLVRGKWDTSYYTGSLQLGAVFKPWTNGVIKPYAGLRYAKTKISGHYERGLSPLVIADFDDTSAQSQYGITVGHKFVVFKRDLAVDLSVGRKHNIRAPRDTLATHYFDSPTTPVTLKRGDYYGDSTAFSLAARTALTSHALVGASVDYETASAHERTTMSILVGYTW
ncbi:autotransporter-associated beta strand protein [Ereboglobus sp. PH5-5]|uniref:autotransporter family protein n=1 Tax=Ereboglobus sp. PH5-5 TaxID=2940529 RepID=UPI002405C229|nr:autotransporter domain-containing protein [Ereboglobus sp. PH5-5]MDF9832165.1 autotransporter-associated beta strand protein [Ereboglobus sp. PH5-5]